MLKNGMNGSDTLRNTLDSTECQVVLRRFRRSVLECDQHFAFQQLRVTLLAVLSLVSAIVERAAKRLKLALDESLAMNKLKSQQKEKVSEHT